MFTNVLVAVDFSASWPLIKDRLEQLQSWGVEQVTLANILSSRYPNIPQETERENFSNKLEALADELVTFKLKIKTRVEVGEPGHSLVKIAREEKSDLMLLGCTGHSRFHKFFIGSTALDAARLCEIPLWLEPVNSPRQLTGISTMILATDGSDAVKGAENLARKLAGNFKRTLAITVTTDGEDNARELNDTKSHLRQLSESIQGLEAKVVSGHPNFVIVEECVKANADLVLVGKRGRNQLAEFVLGSTAEAIARGSECPVLIVPANYR